MWVPGHGGWAWFTEDQRDRVPGARRSGGRGWRGLARGGVLKCGYPGPAGGQGSRSHEPGPDLGLILGPVWGAEVWVPGGAPWG